MNASNLAKTDQAYNPTNIEKQSLHPSLTPTLSQKIQNFKSLSTSKSNIKGNTNTEPDFSPISRVETYFRADKNRIKQYNYQPKFGSNNILTRIPSPAPTADTYTSNFYPDSCQTLSVTKNLNFNRRAESRNSINQYQSVEKIFKEDIVSVVDSFSINAEEDALSYSKAVSPKISSHPQIPLHSEDLNSMNETEEEDSQDSKEDELEIDLQDFTPKTQKLLFKIANQQEEEEFSHAIFKKQYFPKLITAGFSTYVRFRMIEKLFFEDQE